MATHVNSTQYACEEYINYWGNVRCDIFCYFGLVYLIILYLNFVYANNAQKCNNIVCNKI